jgi:glucose/mannose-6-phosphate isomerase
MNMTMRYLVADFPRQLTEALSTDVRISGGFDSARPERVVACGLGGSGIGSRLVAALVGDDLRLPFEVRNDYGIPAYTGAGTLVIISSYSGNTEETIEAMVAARESGAAVVCVTSGGRVADFARQHNLPLALMPEGFPPRSQMGFSVTLQVRFLEVLGLISSRHTDSIRKASEHLARNSGRIREMAGELAGFFEGRVPLVYTGSGFEAVAVRWCQQINENSKMLCHHHVFPEMNHNELVGWEGADNRFAALVLRTAQDHPRTHYRMDICRPMMESRCDRVREIRFEDADAWVNAFEMIHLGDWMSCELAEKNRVDATEIKSIIYLKNQLSQRP